MSKKSRLFRESGRNEVSGGGNSAGRAGSGIIPGAGSRNGAVAASGKDVLIPVGSDDDVECDEHDSGPGLFAKLKERFGEWRRNRAEKSAESAKSDSSKEFGKTGESATPSEEDAEREARRDLERILRRSQPVADRGLYQAALESDWKRILEVGMRDGERGRQLLTCAASRNPKKSLFYVGIDRFESAIGGDETQKLSLKDAQKTFAPLAGKTQLMPGEPLSVLRTGAKSAGTFDVIVLSSGFDRRMIDQCWEFFLQMMHDGSVLLVEPSPTVRRSRWRRLDSEDILEIIDWKTAK